MKSKLEQVFSSELSRNSAKVFAAAENNPVTVTRRDGKDLVLMSESYYDEQIELTELAFTVGHLVLGEDGSLLERMCDAYPWMLVLNDQEKSDCVRDLVEAARTALSLRTINVWQYKFESWFETAYAIANGLGEEPVDWEIEPVQVTRAEFVG